MKPTAILTAALLCALSPISFAKPLKVFILAGQSNMEGHGGVQTLDQLGKHPTHGHLLKKIKREDGSFVVRDDVFVSYKKEGEHIKRSLSVGMGAWGKDWFGPELMFGIGMGDFYQEPVLLIKTCWGGHNLFGCFRPPSAGKPAYEIGDWPKPGDVGASYHKMSLSGQRPGVQHGWLQPGRGHEAVVEIADGTSTFAPVNASGRR